VAAPLFFVSPQQINYQIPAGISAGVATVTIETGIATFTETVEITPVSPGIFAANADGQGVPAAIVRRFSNNQEVFPSVLAGQLNAQSRWVPLPINLGPASDVVVLEMYGTGLRSRSALSAVNVKIGGADGEMIYAGPQPDFAGLDQIDVIIPRSLIGRGEVDVVMTVDGRTANTVRIHIQ
jgi:uncharacterized protein (TIGR03437 family)